MELESRRKTLYTIVDDEGRILAGKEYPEFKTPAEIKRTHRKIKLYPSPEMPASYAKFELEKERRDKIIAGEKVPKLKWVKVIETITYTIEEE